MKTECLIAACIRCYLTDLRVVIFMIGFCAVLLCPRLLYAETQNTSCTELSDKAVNSCGPLALRTVMSLLGHPINTAKCAELAGTDPNGVTTLAGLQSAAQALGCSAKGMNLTPNELASIGCPVILHVSLTTTKDHFVVFSSGKRDSFELLDPTRGQQKNLYAADQLRLMWKGDCIVFTQNPFFTSLKVGTYRARGIISVIIGGALGIFAAILISSRLSRYRGFSLDTVTASARRSIVAVLGCAAIVAAGITFFCLQRVRGCRFTEKGPRLILGTTVLNVGDLEWGKSFMTSIWVGNGGSDILKINKKKVMTSCACIRAAVSKSELKERDKGELKIRLGPPKQMGPFEYSVYVPSNDLQGGKVLTVKGNVTGPGGIVYPPRLYFGRIDGTKRTNKKLFYILRRPGIKILDVTSDLPFATCTFAKRNAAAFEINVSLAEFLKPGPFSGTINILTNDPETEYTEIAVPLSGIVEPKAGNRLSAGLFK